MLGARGLTRFAACFSTSCSSVIAASSSKEASPVATCRGVHPFRPGHGLGSMAIAAKLVLLLPARLQSCAYQALRWEPAVAGKALQSKWLCMPAAAASLTPACLAVFQRDRPPLTMAALGCSSQLQDLRQLLKIMLAARWASATCNQRAHTTSSADRHACYKNWQGSRASHFHLTTCLLARSTCPPLELQWPSSGSPMPQERQWLWRLHQQ